MTNYPILIIEDSDAFFFIVSRALRIAAVNHPIFRCETGDEGMAFLFQEGVFSERQAPRPGIILLDLKLPGTGGREILRAVKSHDKLKTIPVIIMSNSTNEDDILGCYRDGANSYISKPQTTEKIIEAVQRVAVYWLDTVVLPPETNIRE